jgi:hypothetical protein
MNSPFILLALFLQKGPKMCHLEKIKWVKTLALRKILIGTVCHLEPFGRTANLLIPLGRKWLICDSKQVHNTAGEAFV